MTPPRNPTSPGTGGRKRTPSPGTAPMLGLVRGGASSVTSSSFPQSAGASSRQLVLFQLVRARARVLAALQGLTSSPTPRAGAPAASDVRELVSGMIAIDRSTRAEVESHVTGGADRSAVPDTGVMTPESSSWDDLLRRLDTERQALIEAVERIPELPAEVWSSHHPVGERLASLSQSELEQADLIKGLRGAALPENHR
jgi:hypothetical protein